MSLHTILSAEPARSTPDAAPLRRLALATPTNRLVHPLGKAQQIAVAFASSAARPGVATLAWATHHGGPDALERVANVREHAIWLNDDVDRALAATSLEAACEVGAR